MPGTATSSFDGLRPSNAQCERCGYFISGATVKGGCVRCPECGHDSRYDFAVSEAMRERVRSRLARLRVISVLLAIVFLVVVALLAMR